MPGLVLRIAGWVATHWRTLALGASIGQLIDYLRDHGLVDIIKGWIVSEAADKVGLHLDKDEPLTDASLSNALTERLGIKISTVMNREQFQKDMLDGAAVIVGKKTGITIRTLWDREMLIEDLENYALAVIEGRTGVHLSSLHDVEKIKADFVRIGGGVIVEQTGIPLSDITSPEQIKLDVMDWAKDQALMEIGESVNTAVTAEWKQGVTMLQMVRDRIGKKVSPKALLRGVNDAMVQRYMVKVDETPQRGPTKEDRKRYLNKMNQRRFRARADRNNPAWDGRIGGKVEYVPKGWSADIKPPATPVKKRLGGGRSIGLQSKKL